MRNRVALARHKFSCGLPKQLALCLVLAAVCSRYSSAQDVPAHAKWPGPGQLFVGTCYQPVDRSAEQELTAAKDAGPWQGIAFVELIPV
jgi:hypothetical protein